MSILERPVLQLNKSWLPVYVTTVREAIVDLANGTCSVVDTESYVLYDWSSWVALPVLDDQPFIQCAHQKVRAPEWIVLASYDKIPRVDVKLNMRNLWLRDGGRCQYTGRKLSLREATKDHVMPESRGGGNTWENLVTCCPHVNKKKGNKTPKEAGLTLLSEPRKPKWSPLFSAVHKFERYPRSFQVFLPSLKESKMVGIEV